MSKENKIATDLAAIDDDVVAILADLQPADIVKLRRVAAEFKARGVPCPYHGGWTASRVLRAVVARCRGIISRIH